MTNELANDKTWAAQCMKAALTLPTIHLNGTSAEMLLDAIEDAYSAMGAAIQAVAHTAPNGRDYYVQPNGAFEKAQSEHCARIQRLLDVKAELQEMAEGIDAQVQQRNRQRAR